MRQHLISARTTQVGFVRVDRGDELIKHAESARHPQHDVEPDSGIYPDAIDPATRVGTLRNLLDECDATTGWNRGSAMSRPDLYAYAPEPAPLGPALNAITVERREAGAGGRGR